MLDHPNRRPLSPLALLLAAFVSTGCGETEAVEPARELPPGTVLVLDGEPITAAEVDLYIEDLAVIRPAYVVTQRRRQALINIVLPLVYGQVNHAEAREKARTEAEAWRQAYLAGEAVPGPGEERIGNWDILGVDVWWALRHLEVEEWSGVVELPGRFVVLQLLGRDHHEHGGREFFSAHLVEFPYVKHPGNLIVDCLDGTLEIVDPAWREIIPGQWKYRMQGDRE